MSGSTSKDPVIVVVQLSGGNDYMNTVVPHSNSLYRDYRPTVNIKEADVIQLTSEKSLNSRNSEEKSAKQSHNNDGSYNGW